MSIRRTLTLPDGRWWELGWDPPMVAFFAQLYRSIDDEELERRVGEPCSSDIRQALVADQRARPAWV